MNYPQSDCVSESGLSTPTREDKAQRSHTRVVQGLCGSIGVSGVCYQVVDLPARILRFELTDDKFLRNNRLPFCFHKPRDVLLKKKQS